MRLSRWARLGAALVLWGLVVLAGASFVGAGETFGQSANHASLVVDFGGGRVETFCVTFDEEEISGAELLERSGLPVVFSGFGGLGSGVCRIDDTGCSNPGDCFCQCHGADCAYWSYFSVEDGAWEYQVRGASQRMLRDGDVDAWVWGNGRRQPDAGASGACAAPTATRANATATPGPPGAVSTRPPLATSGAPSGQRAPTVEDAWTPVATPQASATPRATSEVRRAGSEREGGTSGRAAGNDGGSSGVPAGLIAFGAVAALLTAGIGGLLVRRRFHG